MNRKFQFLIPGGLAVHHPSSRILYTFCFLIVLICLLNPPVFGGGSPLRTLVVVNDDSDRSLEAGRYYAELRGVPDRQIVHLYTTNRINIDLLDYTADIKDPIYAFISNSGLSNQIDTIVFSMDFPYRIIQPPASALLWSGLTASMFYGFFTSPSAFLFGCQTAPGSNHDYFESEQSFDRSSPLVNHQYYMTAMVTASNLAVAKNMIRRSVGADYSTPSGQVNLLWTLNPDRSIQWKEFGESLFLSEFIDAPQERVWLDASAISGRTNLIGVTAGKTGHSWIQSNTVLPGGFAEHLTSFGGYLFDQAGGQMSILDWIYGGFSGSHGTVVEPCAITNKFVSPRFHYWYARGFSMGESFWMSVRNPYQGVFVGDPLCAPYGVEASMAWNDVEDYDVVSGSVVLTAFVSAVSAEKPIAHLSLWRNGIFVEVVTNLPPSPGNEITVTVNGSNRNYTVMGGDSIFSVTEGLAAELNSSPDLGMTAEAAGDRIVLKQDAIGVDADGWSCTAFVSPGTALVTTVSVIVPETNFVESTLPPREGLALSGSSKSGDVVRVAITRLDGQTFTNEYVVSSDGLIPFSIFFFLSGKMNADTNLHGSVGCSSKYALATGPDSAECWLFSRTNTWEGTDLFVEYEVDAVPGSTLTGPDFSDNFNDNASVLGARATVFVATGATQLNSAITLNTTNWPDGPHEITLIAREGTGVGTESHQSVMLVVSNHDLSCSVDNPGGGIYKLKEGILTVNVSSAVSVGSVTQLLLYAEGKPVATGTVSSLNASVSLDGYGAGPLSLQAHAWADGGRVALSYVTSIILFTDEDGDAVSDQWEYDNFIAATNYNGEADADADGFNNYKEFISDTEPTNAASYLRIDSLTGDLDLTFDSSERRRYQVRLNDDLVNGSWSAIGDTFAGTGDSVLWTNAPPATNTIRLHAIEPLLPQ